MECMGALTTLSQTGNKAIDVRREMVQLWEIRNGLSTVELDVLTASTKMEIANIPDGILTQKMSVLFTHIAKDVGCQLPASSEWAYNQTRLLEVIRKYYGNYSLADIKMAFELATIGRLDDYLPRVQGRPDKAHYQQFNVDYFCKIFNAYRKYRDAVVAKAYDVKTSEPQRTPSEFYKRMVVEKKRNVFLRYKYTGRLEFGFGDEIIIYDMLCKCGLADEVEATEDERKEALRQYMRRAAQGFICRENAGYVRQHGHNCPELDDTAYNIARSHEIKRAFDRMIADEVQIDKYIVE